MSPINPELLSKALHTEVLGSNHFVGVVAERLPYPMTVDHIRTMFAQTMDGVRAHTINEKPYPPFNTDDGAIAGVDITLPRLPWNTVFLPSFLQSEIIQEIYGIKSLHVKSVPNDLTYDILLKKYGDQWEDAIRGQDVFPFVAEFYRASMLLTVENSQKEIRFENFPARFLRQDPKNSTDLQLLALKLHEVMYITAALPESVWNVIDASQIPIRIWQSVMQPINPHSYIIKDFTRINLDHSRQILIRMNRVGMRY